MKSSTYQPRPSRLLWLTAIASSVLLIGFVLSLVDWQTAKQVVAAANRPLAFMGVLLLGLEGFITALRFRLLAVGSVAP